ncbi:MAG: ABZJ_00895 family protein [Pseudomonadota bacterium]
MRGTGEILRDFTRGYTLAFLVTAVLFGSFEAVFGWGMGAIGGLIPVVIGSNRAAERYAASRHRVPDAAEAWYLAGEMAAIAVAVTIVVTGAVVVPMALFGGMGRTFVDVLAALAPGALLASAAAGGGVALGVVRIALPMQVKAALER